MSSFKYLNDIHCDKSSPVPIYYQISQQVTEIINDKKLGKDDKLPTEHELADFLGISRLTARQAYNHLEKIGYVYKIKSRGTFVKGNEDKNFNSLLAVVLFQATSSTVQIIDGIDSILKESQCHMIVRYSNANLQDETKIISELIDKGIQNFIVCPVVIEGQDNSDFFKECQSKGINFILLERKLKNLETDYVGFDNFNAGYNAGVHLLQNDSQRFLFLTSNSQATSILEKQDGFNSALDKDDVDMSNRLTLALPYIDIGYEGAVKALKEYFKSLKSKGQLPISIFTVMSPLALAALNAAKELGIQSPENIKILSGDENEAFAMLTPPVSAFNAPLYKMGKRSAECLLKRIKGRKDPFEKSSLIMELTERKSCGE